MAEATNTAAQSVASKAAHTTRRGEVIPVKVKPYTTDRRAASVALAHPAGIGIEAKYGVLADAAGATGLDFTGKGF